MQSFRIFFDYDIRHSLAHSFANFYPTDMIDTLYVPTVPASICSHTQELTPYKLLNMSKISLNFTNLPFLSWSHSSAH